MSGSRVLVGGELSNPDPRVLRALSTPLIGQFDPAFTVIMDEVTELARRAFQATSARCVPVSGLAAAALEAMLNTLLEPGDRVVALGSIGERVSDLAERYRASVEIIGAEQDPGERYSARSETGTTEHGRAEHYGGGVEVVSAERLAASLEREAARVVVVEHIDPTTGALQPLADLAEVCHAHSALLLVDASLSLGGCELRFDAWGLDAAVAGLEGCLGGPAGLALTVYSAELEAAFKARKQPPTTSYLDLLQLQAYWSPERLNHHTAPTSLVYAAREALRLALVEGLEERWQRHQQIGAGLRAGLSALGLLPMGGTTLPCASATVAPTSAAGATRVVGQSLMLSVLEPPDPALVRVLRDDYGIALGDGGQIALVGENARLETLLVVLASVEQALLALGRAVTPGAARAAALGAV